MSSATSEDELPRSLGAAGRRFGAVEHDEWDRSMRLEEAPAPEVGERREASTAESLTAIHDLVPAVATDVDPSTMLSMPTTGGKEIFARAEVPGSQGDVHAGGDALTLSGLLKTLGFKIGDHLGRSYKAPGGKWTELVEQISDWSSLDAAVLKQPGDHWFRVCPTTLGVRAGSRGRADDCARLTALWIDIDYFNDKGAVKCPSEAAALNIIDNLSAILGVPPAAVTYSGNGIHAYWRISDGDIGTQLSLADAQELLGKWKVVAQAVGCAHGAHVDSVMDLARVMRTPGTLNHKIISGQDPEPKKCFSVFLDGGPIEVAGAREALDGVDLSQYTDSRTVAAGTKQTGRDDEAWSTGLPNIEIPVGVCPWTAGLLMGMSQEPEPAERHKWARDLMVKLYSLRRVGCIDDDAALERSVALVQERLLEFRDLSDRFEFMRLVRDAEKFVDSDTPDEVRQYVDHSCLHEGELDPALALGHRKWAHQLADRYGTRLMFVGGVGWHVWDESHWQMGERGQAEQTVYKILDDAAAAAIRMPQGTDDERRARRSAFNEIRSASTANGVASILTLASKLPEFAFTVSDLDADPYLLNTPCGTYDLRSGEVLPPNPGNRITKVTRAAISTQAAGPAWTGFLERVLPNAEIRDYLQRVAGVSLLGKQAEHILPILTGIGRNGKGTWYSAVKFALGDYAAMADPQLFTQREGAHPTGQMDLLGRRFVVVSETAGGIRMDEALMKRLTGGDPIKARRMHKDFVEFDPSHLVMMVTNHLPKVRGDDPATFARLRVIPFDVVVPEQEQDKHLDEKLQAEADAVLAWCLAGWHDYRRRGEELDAPEAVRTRTEEYRVESDVLYRFISEQCVTGSGCRSIMSAVWSEFSNWCSAERINPGEYALGTSTALGKALDRMGYPVRRDRDGRWRHGIEPKRMFDARSSQATEGGNG